MPDAPGSAAGREAAGRASRYALRMPDGQRFRLRAPSSGDEAIIEAEPGVVYLDERTGEQMEVVGEVLPLAPSRSRLPWAVENLRFCNWCDSMAQRDLNECPTCGRRMAPLG